MSNEKYNGWANWDTWNCFNFLTMDEDIQKHFGGCKNSEQVWTLFNKCFVNEDYEAVDGINMANINWAELYERR